MSAARLQARLSSVTSTYKQTIPLIHRLQNFTPSVGQGDGARVELASEIHHRLREIEEEMELLRVEVEPLESMNGPKRTGSEARENEREETVSMMRRLDEDLKTARSQFRKAQLQAKRNAEAARQKERQILFSGATEDDVARRKTSSKLTHDDLVVNASNDVTSALRRTHQLMQSELSRSRFAQETLEQSTTALSSLSESYSNLDSLLSSSRTLVSSLLRSQKSDTWYLETAFYILIGTIIWLLFRRVFYGPLWWLIWLPIKMAYRLMFAVMAAMGLSSGTSQTTNIEYAGMSTSIPPTMAASGTPSVVLDATGTPEAMGTAGSPDSATAESILQDIEDKAGVSQKSQPRGAKEEGQATNADEEERQRQESAPRNPKKRMWEEDIKKDEL